jgi:chaperonin cofactor prefoldin
MNNGTNGSQSNGDRPPPDPTQKLTEYVETLELSIEIQEDKTDAIEDRLANLSEQVTELKQQVQDIYGDEDDWERMSKT